MKLQQIYFLVRSALDRQLQIFQEIENLTFGHLYVNPTINF